MPRARVYVMLGWWLIALATTLAPAQSRKPGLWTIITTLTNSTAGAPGHPTTSTTNVCLTQALIDKFGAPVPNLGPGCRITEFQKTSSSLSGEMVCSGALTGHATMQSSWTADHATGSMHFVGTAPRPVEWTTNSTSVFKSSDCGSVPPYPMPPQ